MVIDAGHGGNDEGAKRGGVLEKNETLEIAKKLNDVLRDYGFRTVMTRDSDRYVSLAERVTIANRLENALFVSIHFNDSGDRSAEGVETYYSAQKVPAQEEWTWVGLFNDSPQLSEESELLAGYIQVAIISRTNTQNRGIKSSHLYVTRNTRCPAVLVEAGFLSNALERQLVSNDDYRARLAGGIASGILEFIKNQRQIPAPILASMGRPKEFAR
jgi:N-acetylmuramoyl-L-alanine amidase